MCETGTCYFKENVYLLGLGVCSYGIAIPATADKFLFRNLSNEVTILVLLVTILT